MFIIHDKKSAKHRHSGVQKDRKTPQVARKVLILLYLNCSYQTNYNCGDIMIGG